MDLHTSPSHMKSLWQRLAATRLHHAAVTTRGQTGAAHSVRLLPNEGGDDDESDTVSKQQFDQNSLKISSLKCTNSILFTNRRN